MHKKTYVQLSEEERLKELLEKHAEEFKRVGFLFHIFIQIESNLNNIIEIFFCELNQTKNLIFNQALLDEKIFPNIENKRKFLLKIIQHLTEIAKRDGLSFDGGRRREFCKSIQSVQRARNKLAHKFLAFTEGNIASYLVRKDLVRFETQEIKLDDEIEKAKRVLKESHMLHKFLEEAFPITHGGEENLCCIKEVY